LCLFSSYAFILRYSRKINEDLTAAVGSSLRNTAAGGPLAPISISDKENSLLEADYPAIKYWKKKTYTTTVDEKKDEGNILKVTNGKPQRGKTRLAETGENVSMDYIETLDGKSIDGTTASSIRAYLRSLFIELNNEALKGENLMPTSWGTSSASMRDGILLRLYAKYPYIRFCQDDWKADYLLSRSYSTWRSGEKKKAGKVKIEPKTEDVKPFDGASARPVPAKRERSPAAPDSDVDGPSPPKKARVDMEMPPHAAPDLPMPANATTTALVTFFIPLICFFPLLTPFRCLTASAFSECCPERYRTSAKPPKPCKYTQHRVRVTGREYEPNPRSCCFRNR
jgi:hypothetical protein